tara:strand:- start:92 stop:691 length:600 start_codon:yes stop_codon:yes gene_type:complete
MFKYIFSTILLLVINVSAEEIKYECECKYAEVYVKDPIQNIEDTQEDANCEKFSEGNSKNIIFIINLNDEYIYDAEYKSLRSKLEKIDDSKYLAYITNDQFKEMFKSMTNDNSNPEEMSDFGKGMIEMLGGMFEFATFGQKSSFEILIDGRIQKEDEMSIEMNFAEMFKGLDIPFEDGFPSSENFITTVSSYSMCKEIK